MCKWRVSMVVLVRQHGNSAQTGAPASSPPLPPQGYLCCTGRPMAPRPGASTLLWALPDVDQGALAAAPFLRNVCPRMGLQVLGSAAVLRAGLALTAAWLCVLRTAMPTPEQESVTRYGWDRWDGNCQVGWSDVQGSSEFLFAVPRA